MEFQNHDHDAVGSPAIIVSILPAALRNQPFLSADDIGKMLGRAPITIARHCRGERTSPFLKNFPAPAVSGSGNKLCWHAWDVAEWVLGRNARRQTEKTARAELDAWREANRRPVGRPRVRPLPDPDAPKRRVGRPTKAEQAARAAAQQERGVA